MKRLFIVGVGRSGTSLLQSMMAAHSKIVMMPETSFVRRYLVTSLLSIKSKATTYNFGEDTYLHRWQKDGAIDLNQHDAITADKILTTYQDVVTAYADSCQHMPIYVAEKDPKMIEILPFMSDIFDDFKIIHIIRDPRDVVLSKNKASWSKGQSLLKKIIANHAQMNIVGRFQSSNKLKILEVYYEKLIQNPEQVLLEICRFLDLDYEPNMQSFQKEAQKLVANDEFSWKKETVGPLLSNNCNKWKEEMSVSVSSLVETCCTRSMKKGQYETSMDKIGLVQKVKNWLTYALIKVVSSIYVINAVFLKKAVKKNG